MRLSSYACARIVQVINCTCVLVNRRHTGLARHVILKHWRLRVPGTPCPASDVWYFVSGCAPDVQEEIVDEEQQQGYNGESCEQ